MAYLYKVLSGTVYHQGLHLDISTLISPEEDPLLEPMIAAGMVGREDIQAFSALASGSIGAYTGIYLASAGVVSQMTEANVNGCIGITIEAAADGHEVRYIKGGPAIGMLLGDASIADGTSVIAGTNGKAVAFQLAQSKLLDGGTGLGTSQDDITQTPWAGTGGDYVYVHTSVDNASDRGKIVTIYYIVAATGFIESEDLTLSLVDSSDQIQSTYKASNVLGYSVNQTFNGTLVIDNTVKSAGKSQGQPSSANKYGFYTCTTTTTNGHRVRLHNDTGSITGNLVAVWETQSIIPGENVIVLETVAFAGTATGYTLNAYGILLGVFVGADGRANSTYTFSVEANSAAGVIGTITGAQAANAIGTMRYSLCTTPLIHAISMYQGTITPAQTDYMGPGINTEATTEYISFIVPYYGSIEGIYCNLGTASGAGASTKKTICTVRQNAGDTSMAVTLLEVATSGKSEGSYAFAVQPGDLIDVKVVEDSGGSAANLNVTLLYKAGA